MATPYQEIYDLYIPMTEDWNFLNLPIQDQNIILDGWLKSAIIEFDTCKEDLSNRDDTLRQFNIDLSDKVKKILARFILVEWLNPKLYTLQFLQSQLSSKDFNQFSPANHLKEVRSCHGKAEKRAIGEKIKYGYNNFDPLKDLVSR